MIDERVFQALNEIKNIERFIKRVKVVKIVDPNGKVWGVGGGETNGPCGCELEAGGMAFRLFLYCPNHPENGILFNEYAENGQWFWTNGKLTEVKK